MASLQARVTREAIGRMARVIRRRRAAVTRPDMTAEERYLLGGRSLRATMRPQKVLYRQPDDIDIAPSEGPVEGLWVTGRDLEPGRTVLHLHGGAYLAGSPNTHRGMATALTRATGAAVLLPKYRLAPEHRYPAAIDDALATYEWLLGPGGQDPARLVLSGDSAGGGLALALAVAARDRGLPQPAGLALLSPWTDLTGSGRSVDVLADADPWIDASTIAQAGEMYAGDDVAHPWASPVFADFSGLAPLLVHVGSDEVLLDDASRVVARARAAGVEASIGVFDGMFHVFQAFAWLPESRRSYAEIGGFVRRVTGDLVGQPDAADLTAS